MGLIPVEVMPSDLDITSPCKSDKPQRKKIPPQVQSVRNRGLSYPERADGFSSVDALKIELRSGLFGTGSRRK